MSTTNRKVRVHRRRYFRKSSGMDFDTHFFFASLRDSEVDLEIIREFLGKFVEDDGMWNLLGQARDAANESSKMNDSVQKAFAKFRAKIPKRGKK